MFPPEDSPTASFPYRIESQVGVGSMGIVYKAVEVALERTVAIKVLRPSMLEEETPEVQDDLRRRFLQEARAAATLSHPGVTTVYRVGEEGGIPYIVMEWLAGRTLEEMLEEGSRFSVAAAARLLVDLLDTLQVAHTHGVIHRDIKPGNLVLLDDGRLKVTDFGIALLQGRELVKTQAGVVLATPKFAAPEQLRGIEVDGRSDLFAVGILLYRLVSGQYPFEGQSFMELANAILAKEPTPVRDLVADVPLGIEAILRTALHKERRDRFESAAAMAQALHPFTVNAAPDVPPSAETAPAKKSVVSTIRIGPAHYELPADPRLAMVRVVDGWPSKPLSRQPIAPLLDRLLEKPFHAPAFAGALSVGDTCLFLRGGVLLGAIDRRTGQRGDQVVEGLPEAAVPTLFPLPANLPEGVVTLMASILHPPKVRHADLDSSFVNLPALASKLREEKFDGMLRLQRGEAWALIFFDQGNNALSVFSKGWDQVQVEESWQRWVSEVSVRATVEEKHERPLNLWYRRGFREFPFLVRPIDQEATKANPSKGSGSGSSSSARVRQMFQSSHAHPLATGQLKLHISPAEGSTTPAGHIGYEQAPAFRLLSWMLDELPQFLARREKTQAWKYLSEWIPLVRNARLHHELPRSGSRESDYFDLVTSDEQGKVLHLGQRMAGMSADIFEEFLQKVIEAKTARIKGGDIGGVVLVAPEFGDDVLEAYAERVKNRRSSTFFGMEESLTGYAGFVRIGARRGFHLLLVQEHPKTFEPLLPA